MHHVKIIMPKTIHIVSSFILVTAFSICARANEPLLLSDSPLSGSAATLSLDSKSRSDGIWVDGSVGNGFLPWKREAGFSVGGAFATHDFGGRQPHDLVLSRAYIGWMLGPMVGGDHWYRGNFELIQDLFGGVQLSPTRYLVGETTLLRYSIATRTRWVPFMEFGGGSTLSDIGRPDLSPPYQFNLQIGPGVHYFWKKDCALTAQFRYLHLSNAGIITPNQGVNEMVFYAGLAWFF